MEEQAGAQNEGGLVIGGDGGGSTSYVAEYGNKTDKGTMRRHCLRAHCTLLNQSVTHAFAQ